MSGTRALPRLAIVSCLVVTIAAGLLVHLRGGMLGAAMQDVAGDALWATMMAWWVALLFPQVSLTSRAVVAYAICVAVEVSQLVHTSWLDAVRDTSLGHLVLGSDFDARDLVAYAAGVVVALLLERVVLARRSQGNAQGRA